jgi:hypothetical protein
MIGSKRGIPLVAALVAAAVAIVLVAALTSWWVLLFLFPLAMMVGCAAMMATRLRMPGCASAAWGGCCPAAWRAPRTESPLEEAGQPGQ